MLLNKKTSQRTCSFQSLKMCDYFENFNWDDLIEFKLNAPFIPKVFDCSTHLNNLISPYENFITVIIYKLGRFQ